MLWTMISAGVMAVAVFVTPTSAVAAQVAIADPWIVRPDRPTTVSGLLSQIDRRARFAATGASEFRADDSRLSLDEATRRTTPWVASSRDLWFEGGAYSDRLRMRSEGRLRRADGSPLPPGPQDSADLDAEHFDVTYTRGWTETLARTESGLDVTLTPHLGVGVGDRGGTTEAGATLRIGRDLDKLVPDGGDAFGSRPRWYLYAAGSGRAIGYNWARTRDGDFARSGVSHDSGAFLGDASIGVAMRRGAVQGSIGLVYREIEAEGIIGGDGIDTDVSEGLIAFQLSIKPE
ncbi:lipid A-modifier LpxR family protein [Brevundimonas sp.]|uniref:lipid A-modifier LpxR family protein n=1 Tax=Brevundimonas sp. TaxID=1871086 RepID=UPI00356AEAD9